MRTSRRKLKPGYQDGVKPTHQVYYIEMKRKSKAGVEYIYYKPIVDIIKEKTKDDSTRQNSITRTKS